ncbi:MAG: pectinesterase family protein [Tannerellaceae bacterium]|nr:pectinesterase family protein [Tannerellaceae bacterium]
MGSGDTLQVNGSVYLVNCTIEGDGDTVLGRGPAFFQDCTLVSYDPFMWIRNTEANHGNIFVNCTFLGQGENAVIARSPINNGRSYPYAEAVLIDCKIENIHPAGWGTI